MKFEFYDYKSQEMTEEVVDSLYKQNICMDDWDYLLFFSVDYIAAFPKGWDNVTVAPSNYTVGRLLNGCCYNKWYPVENFMGKKGFLGVAYHA